MENVSVPILGGQFVLSLNTKDITSRSLRSILLSVPRSESTWVSTASMHQQSRNSWSPRPGWLTRHTTMLHLTRANWRTNGANGEENIRAVFVSDFAHYLKGRKDTKNLLLTIEMCYGIFVCFERISLCGPGWSWTWHFVSQDCTTIFSCFVFPFHRRGYDYTY